MIRVLQIIPIERSVWKTVEFVTDFDYPATPSAPMFEIQPGDPVATQNLWFIQAFVDSLGVMAS